MIATFASFALPLLFAGSGLFAMIVLGLTWRTYGRELAVLRAQLAATTDYRELAVWTATTQVREFAPATRRGGIRLRAAAAPARRPAKRRAA